MPVPIVFRIDDERKSPDAEPIRADHGIGDKSAAETLPVLIDTSATREIDRMDDPSQSMARIWVRLARGSWFMALQSNSFKLTIPSHIRYNRSS